MIQQEDKMSMGSAFHVWALFHAIGQLEDIHRRGATIAEIARFMNVSKPCVMARLDRLITLGDLVLITNKEFGRFGRVQIELNNKYRGMYDKGTFKACYGEYCQRVLKVMLTDV